MKYFILISMLLFSCTQNPIIEPDTNITQMGGDSVDLDRSVQVWDEEAEELVWKSESFFSLDDIMAQLDPEFDILVPFQLTINHGIQEEGFWWQLMYIKGKAPGPTQKDHLDNSM